MVFINTKITNIYNKLKLSPYNGTNRNQHFSVAIRGGKLITPVGNNYHRSKVFGMIRGTIHAEMNTLNYILNSLGNYNKHTRLPKNGRYLL